MSENIKIFALGGLDEEGRDCYVVDINDDIFVLDCGMALPDKTIPGIDSLLPNFSYLIENKNRIKAYIITHGHDEVMGALKYFYNMAPAPIYCTKTTADYLVYEAKISKIKADFEFEIVNASDTKIIAHRKVRFFQTCHNMSYSFGVAISTDRGNIVYSSDYIIDYTVKDEQHTFDMKKLSEIAEDDTFLLLSESKCANLDGYCAPHHRVVPKIEHYFDDNKRIFFSCFWENAFRINELFSLAKNHKKKVYYYDKYTKEMMDFLAGDSDAVDTQGVEIVADENLLRVAPEDLVILMLGHDEKIYEDMLSLYNRDNPDRRIILNKDDIFIIGAIPTEIYEVTATRCIDFLYRSGCQVVWLKRKNIPAMHARKDDIKYLLSLLRPKYYFPVRGSYTNLIENAKLAVDMGVGLNHMNVFIFDNGMQAVFDDRPRPTIISDLDSGINVTPILVDGAGISHFGSEVIEDRLKLGIDGVAIICATVSKAEKKIIAGPDCQMRGFVYVKEAEPLLKSITQIYLEEVNKALLERNDLRECENLIKERVKRYIKRENGRDPLIIVSIIEAD